MTFTLKLCEELRRTVVSLIEEENVKWFLFGDGGNFCDVCLQMVTDIKRDYPSIQRVYIRVKDPYLSAEKKSKILEEYDDTIIPAGIENAGKAVYVERNQAMVNASDFCVFYYNSDYIPPLRKRGKKMEAFYQPKSGTEIAFQYAFKKKKPIINLYKRK